MKKYIDEEGYEVIMWSDGPKHWYKNGKLHRENNPAYQSKTHFHYFLNSKKYTNREYWSRLLLLEY